MPQPCPKGLAYNGGLLRWDDCFLTASSNFTQTHNSNQVEMTYDYLRPSAGSVLQTRGKCLCVPIVASVL